MSRVLLVRHGETEWSQSGQFTGTTDIELTEAGATQVSSAAARLVGHRKFLDPLRLAHVFVSPRSRAVKTFELFLGPFLSSIKGKTTYTEDIAEWKYGAYEGFTDEQTRSLRKKKGLDQAQEWSIWRDGCEDGDSREEVTERLDRLISQIKNIQRPYIKENEPADVLIVAHGLINRCFVKRWLNKPIDFDLQMKFAPGAIAVLSYKNNDMDKPELQLGVALPPSDEDSVKS
ncbi:hypothetical protein BDV06DRAFT_233805 [Aspergillus oleicola]